MGRGIAGLSLVREEQRVYQERQEGRLHGARRRFKLIDAFAGAGGMTLGFSDRFGHAFDPVWANDSDDRCLETYGANFGAHCEYGDIVGLLKNPSVKIP